MNRLQISSALLLSVAFALPNISHAQPAPAVNAANAVETVDIKVGNVSVGLLAYWLDPAHQIVPQQLQLNRDIGGYWTRESDALPRQAGNANGPRDLKLPAGIESIASIDPQNVLRVKGTAAGIEELKKLVVELDVPIRQVEVEAQFCQMSPQTLKTLPLKFAANEDSSYAPSVAQVPPTVNLNTELSKLVADKKVRIITKPRMTAIDGLAAQHMSSQTRPMALSTLAKNPADMSDADEPWLPGLAMVRMDTGLTCMPIFHGDLIKLFTRSTLNDRSANVSANLRDGESIAIVMPFEKSDTNNRTVIFVTAHIVRRAGARNGRDETGNDSVNPRN